MENAGWATADFRRNLSLLSDRAGNISAEINHLENDVRLASYWRLDRGSLDAITSPEGKAVAEELIEQLRRHESELRRMAEFVAAQIETLERAK